MRGDAMSRFHNALFLGDAEERVKVRPDEGPPTFPPLSPHTIHRIPPTYPFAHSHTPPSLFSLARCPSPYCLTPPHTYTFHALIRQVLEATGQLPLAYVAAKTHGLEEDAARLQVPFLASPYLGPN